MWYLTDKTDDCYKVLDTDDCVEEYVTEQSLRKISKYCTINGVSNDILQVMSLNEIVALEVTLGNITGTVYQLRSRDITQVLGWLKDEDKWSLYVHYCGNNPLFMEGIKTKSAVIKIPYGVTDVSTCSFDDTVVQVDRVTDLILPDTVRYLWAGSILRTEENASSVTNLRLSNNLVHIGGFNFAAMPIKAVDLPDSLRYISNHAFCQCRNLKSIVLPANLKHIGDYAFSDCIRLENVDFSKAKSIESIADGAFFQTRIKEFIFPEGVTNVAPRLLAKCAALHKVVLSSKATVIGYASFIDCEKLKDCIIPEGVTSIANNAFSGCVSLTEMLLPKSMQLIERAVWCGCVGLKKLQLPEEVMKMSIMLVSGCSSLTQIRYPRIKEVLYLVRAVRTYLAVGTEKYLPHTYYEFWGCKSLKVISIGAAQYYAYQSSGCATALRSESVLKYEIRPDERYVNLTVVVKDLIADNAIRHTLIVPEGTQVDFSGYVNVDSVSLIYRG